MKKFLLALFLNLFFLHTAIAQLNQDKITILLHGGAGTISRENMTAEALVSEGVNIRHPDKLFIGGEWVAPTSGRVFQRTVSSFQASFA